MIKKASPPVKKSEEPRFKAEPEPTRKTPYATYKNEWYIWDGKEFILASVRYGDVATGNITMEIAKWLKTDEYQKLRKESK